LIKARHERATPIETPNSQRGKNTYWPEKLQSLGDIKKDSEKMGITEKEMPRIFTYGVFNSGRLVKYTQNA
jgi:hypothetical protein